MIEPPNKRPRRFEDDRGDRTRRRESPERSTRDSRRDDRGGRERYDRDSNRERDRRYRSRSRSRDRERERHNDRDRNRDRYGERSGRRDEGQERDKDRDSNRENVRGNRRDDGRDRRDYRNGREGEDRDRGDRKRYREDEDPKGDKIRNTRSRSPIREPSVPLEVGRSPARARAFDDDDGVGSKSRTVTPPVAFKVGLGVQGHAAAVRLQREASAEANGERSSTPSAYVSDVMDTDAPAASDSKMPKKNKRSGKQSKVEEKNVEDDDDVVIEEDDSMAAMQTMLGFGGFGTTKQKKIAGNDVYAVRKEKKTEYRQYMNRVGGFNRPLSPSRE